MPLSNTRASFVNTLLKDCSHHIKHSPMLRLGRLTFLPLLSIDYWSQIVQNILDIWMHDYVQTICKSKIGKHEATIANLIPSSTLFIKKNVPRLHIISKCPNLRGIPNAYRLPLVLWKIILSSLILTSVARLFGSSPWACPSLISPILVYVSKTIHSLLHSLKRKILKIISKDPSLG